MNNTNKKSAFFRKRILFGAPPGTRFSRELRARSSAVANVHRKFALYRFPSKSLRDFDPGPTAYRQWRYIASFVVPDRRIVNWEFAARGKFALTVPLYFPSYQVLLATQYSFGMQLRNWLKVHIRLYGFWSLTRWLPEPVSNQWLVHTAKGGILRNAACSALRNKRRNAYRNLFPA